MNRIPLEQLHREPSLKPALVCLSIAAALLLWLLASGCGFPAALARTHTAVKEASSYIEPPLAAECLKRAKVCADAGKTAADCPPLTECRGWKATYVLAAQRLHQGAAALNRLYNDLRKVRVIK